MNKLFAVIKTFNAGYDREKETMKDLGLKIGDRFEVSAVHMGGFSTSIELVGYKEYFNSVFFSFEDESGKPFDIFSSPMFNPYL